MEPKLRDLATVFRYLDFISTAESRVTKWLRVQHMNETWQFAKCNPGAVREAA